MLDQLVEQAQGATPRIGPRVGFVKQTYSPDMVVPRQIIESLQRRGVRMRVITGPVIDDGGRRVGGQPIARVVRDVRDGVEYLRFPSYETHDSSAVRRVLTYGSFSSVTAAGVRRAFADLDVVLVYGSPATAALGPLVAARRYGTPFVFHVQDVWPDSVFATGFLTDGLVRRAADRGLTTYLDTVYRNAHSVVTISPEVRELLVRRGVPDAKLHTIYNWTDERLFSPAPVSARTDAFEVLYAGNLGHAQALDSAIQAMALLRSRGVRLRLVGAGPAEPQLRRQVEELGLADVVVFHGPVSAQEVPELMRGAQAQLVSLADEPLFRITLPSKLQAALSSGSPVVVAAPGAAGRIVAQAGAGLLSRPKTRRRSPKRS